MHASITRRGFLAMGAALLPLLLASCSPSSASSAPSASSPQSTAFRDHLAAAQESALNAMAWSELSALSERIGAAPDDATAALIGAEAGLLDDAGAIDRSQAKVVELSDGTLARVRLAGYRRGTLPDGTAAGLTFFFQEPIAFRGMTDAATAEGGWRSSPVRSWLNGEALDLLPADLREAIRPARKLTTETPDGPASATEDRLWLFSESELAGWTEQPPFPGLADEGPAYQLFEASPAGTDAFDDAYIRSDAETGAWECWWERTLDPNRDGFLFRSYGGTHTIAIQYAPNFELGIAPGFCV